MEHATTYISHIFTPRNPMSAETITTVVKMLENLPDMAQQQVAEHLRDYLADIQPQLMVIAQEAKRQTEKNTALRRLDDLRQARGLWADRQDLPDFETLRREWDRPLEAT
jgi:hypothetical protein